ncbi:pentatricopeptide repeat domain-containing protein [Ophiocordyceps sinensis CO18]|uniref:Pentatricopeptide repeat domain-containing protein n=2 Tax=Ophiocordyceps sinensis TaxID=72228 RepID=T5AEC7_OPHSC|nr:pentatricopeptide repeat domain-containing protein [Ophiocordyceps sinensis CO18]
MPKTLPPILRFPPAARIATEPASRIAAKPTRPFYRELVSPAGPLIPAMFRSERTRAPHRPFHKQAEDHWNPPVELRTCQTSGRSGSARMRHAASPSHVELTAISDQGTRQAPHTAEAIAELQSSSLKSWEHRLLTLRRERGDDGTWAVFQSIQTRGLSKLLALPEAKVLRDGVLAAALDHDVRIAIILRVAHQLYAEENFKWPEIYLKIMHSCLGQARFSEAVRCHMLLAPSFPPGAEVFGAMFLTFVVDPSLEMQDTLRSLYILNTERGLYDHIIPVLFSSGQSKLARTWRKTFIIFKDFPTTAKSSRFLTFLASYYPFVVLADEELSAARLRRLYLKCGENDEITRPVAAHDASTGQYSDSLVAKWIASLWTSVEFAISLAHKLGLRVIGPRSLQSLAFRELDAQGFAARIAQLEKMGIKIAPQTYCKVLVVFAKHGKDDLLADLVNCDIHPDEFDKGETRRMLLTASARERDWKRTRLLQGVEWAIGTESSSRRLDALLRSGLIERKAGKIRDALDRMDALGHSVTQDSASQLLRCTFDGLSSHPTEWTRPSEAFDTDLGSVLNSAIDFTRRLACRNAAIPLRYWRLIIYNLGRLGRFDELEQICLELVQLYMPASGGLIPVHREDWPQQASGKTAAWDRRMAVRTEYDSGADNVAGIRMKYDSNRDDSMVEGWTNGPCPADDERNSLNPDSELKRARRGDFAAQAAESQSDEREYIPSDLPFTYREHPVQKLFDPYLQRSVVRWGFDQTLTTRPSAPAVMEMSTSGIREFDVACGVRLLAILRNQGVCIDTHIVRTAVISRIALGQVPGRRKDRSRDENEMAEEHLKHLVEKAWGSAIFPSLAEMRRDLQRQEPKLWSRYPRLFGKSYDRRNKPRSDAG